MSLLEMKHIKKHFDDVEVLQDISLKVDEGQVLQLSAHPDPENPHCFVVRRTSKPRGRRDPL